MYINLSLISGLMLVTLQAMGQDYTDPQNMPVDPKNTNCQHLPEVFADGTAAIARVKAAKFNYHQNFKTTRRSGLMQASYASCDFKIGYLMVTYDGNEMIYPNVPMALWKEFQSTSDIDGFYFKKIKDLPAIL